MSPIFSFQIICAVVPDTWIFFRIAASVANNAVVNLNGVKTF